MITQTQVIILKSVDYQESSKIITVLSKEHGKIALMARGVKKPKSKLAGSIELGNILDVVYYYKPTRGVQSLTEVSVAFSSLNFRMDFDKASVLYAVLEMVGQLVHEHEVNSTIFNFTQSFIPWLAEQEQATLSVFCYAQIRCAELCGFNLTVQNVDTNQSTFLDITHGLISNEIGSELSYKLTVLQTQFLRAAIETKNRSIFELGLQGGELKQLIHHLDVYFKYHIEGFKDRRSDQIFEQMLQDTQ
jgi:DNA repair protein RecO